MNQLKLPHPHLKLFGLGQRVEVVDLYPEVPPTTLGTVVGWTEDNGSSTYAVKFDNGEREEQVYSDEIKALKSFFG